VDLDVKVRDFQITRVAEEIGPPLCISTVDRERPGAAPASGDGERCGVGRGERHGADRRPAWEREK